MPRKKRRPIHGNIRALREALKMSQVELARIAGVDKSAVHHWENGLSAPKGRRLPIVAKALGVSLDELFAEVA